MNQSLRNNPPEGFKVKDPYEFAFTIEYERTGMLGMNLFLAVFCLFCSVGVFIQWKEIFMTLENSGFQFEAFAKGVVILCIDLLLLYFLAYYLFAEKTFLFDENHLVMETRVLSYRKSTIINKDQVSKVTQVKDGGGKEDSFPGWGITVTTDKNHKLIVRQPDMKSYWFGKVVADWADVKYDVEVDNDDDSWFGRARITFSLK